MDREILLKQSNLEVSFDKTNKIMYCTWLGFQNKEKIMTSGEKIIELLKSKKCGKVLNDNTSVSGPWQDAAEWTAKNWFPRMEEAGLKYFAWVFSPNIFAELSAQKAKPDSEVVTTFHSVYDAEQWLKSNEVVFDE
ncbi:hypothetical protein LVD15_02470 [Fulvivirga maritima]|uniref:hypothetical protein n=1 Tax=Fulvivirga maritima TaxID=2904247 RepID=UPI001F388F30|nr:hypothetical protein [Fulvivirga maritima]UII27313.1 hypothetical protein LVD15_02470 [Fulvivirga maritima]